MILSLGATLKFIINFLWKHCFKLVFLFTFWLNDQILTYDINNAIQHIKPSSSKTYKYLK